MILGLLQNWKTTSAGLTLIIGAVVHIVFIIAKRAPITEMEIMLAVGSILGGIGMLAAGDASKAKKDLSDLKQQTKDAVDTGDTRMLSKFPGNEGGKS